MSLNPLLFLTTDNQSPNNDYNCDLYDDQLYGKSNFCNHEDYPLVNDDCSSQSSDDSLNQYYLMHNDTLEDPEHYPKYSSPQSDAQNRFQVMLHDLIMRHKAIIWSMSILCPRTSLFTQNYNVGNHSSVTWKVLTGHTYSGQQIVMSHCTMVKL